MKIRLSRNLALASSLMMFIASCSPVNCENEKYDYQNGYSSGKTGSLMGGSGSCKSYVDSYNEQTGRRTMEATDCFCDGFKDGLNDKPSKY